MEDTEIIAVSATNVKIEENKKNARPSWRSSEATAGFEPAMEVLQTSALTTWLRRHNKSILR